MSRALVVGGMRSGKSRFAESRFGDAAVTYIATGEPDDDDPEWTARIATHRARRPTQWQTVETLDVAGRLRDAERAEPLLIDCINGWLAGTMRIAGCWDEDDKAAARLADAVDDLVDAWSATAADAVAVTNEVGMALVPTTRPGRWFAEELGALNARLAGVSDEVWQVTVGIPHRLR